MSANCPFCGNEVEQQYRFCPQCAAPLRSKLVEFFLPHPDIESDRGRALRVSRYLDSPEGISHTRFSVWDERGRAEAAVSLDEDEAARLIRFLQGAGNAGIGAVARRTAR